MRYLPAFFFLITMLNAEVEPWMKEARYSLTSGNDLYGYCKAAENRARTMDGGKLKYGGTPHDAMEANTCYSYIRGVVDSIPAPTFTLLRVYG